MFHRAARLSIAFGVLNGVRSNSVAFADKKSHEKRIVIVGGGTGGVGVAAMLAGEGIKNITIIDPSSSHYYQPLWTLVGGGLKKNSESVKPMEAMIGKNATLIRNSVASFQPEENSVTLANGDKVSYDYLVVAAGMQIDWNKIEGLTDAIANPESGIVSIYDYNSCANTWKQIEKFQGGRAIFTFPPTLIKCAGAPQKIMWLCEDDLRHRQDKTVRGKSQIEYWVPGEAMFGIKKYSDMLEVIRQQRGVGVTFKHELVSVNAANKTATFKNLKDGSLSVQTFDLLHVTPPMSSPDFIKKSALANAAGWVDVDKHTLQSVKYANVFALGDCCSTPNSKTAAAITAQAPVLVHNLHQVMHGATPTGHYNGYASCPLIISKDKVLLAEFGYDGKIMETFNGETGKFPLKYIGQEGDMQQKFFMFMKKEVFPAAYWHLWPKGMWYGTNGVFKPSVVKECK